MKRFRFRLEAVRTLREVAELGQREAFGAAQQRLAAAERTAQAAADARRDLSDRLAGSRTGTFRPAEQSSGLEALSRAMQREATAAKARQEAVEERDRARESWLGARRALQIIQKLEEKARSEHRAAADKNEQTLLDELASIGVARTTADGPRQD